MGENRSSDEVAYNNTILDQKIILAFKLIRVFQESTDILSLKVICKSISVFPVELNNNTISIKAFKAIHNDSA